MAMLRALWLDETGFIISAELILIASIVLLGLIVGLTAVRDTMTTELADTATALGQMNQSFSYGGATGHSSSTAGSFFTDAGDYCDNTVSNTTNAGTACTNFVVPATPEGGTL